MGVFIHHRQRPDKVKGYGGFIHRVGIQKPPPYTAYFLIHVHSNQRLGVESPEGGSGVFRFWIISPSQVVDRYRKGLLGKLQANAVVDIYVTGRQDIHPPVGFQRPHIHLI